MWSLVRKYNKRNSFVFLTSPNDERSRPALSASKFPLLFLFWKRWIWDVWDWLKHLVQKHHLHLIRFVSNSSTRVQEFKLEKKTRAQNSWQTSQILSMFKSFMLLMCIFSDHRSRRTPVTFYLWKGNEEAKIVNMEMSPNLPVPSKMFPHNRHHILHDVSGRPQFV